MESIEKLRGLIKPARNGWYSYIGALYDDVEKAADAIEREIADNYMKLPLDADGVPIHVGDEVEAIHGANDKHVVFALKYEGHGAWVAVLNNRGLGAFTSLLRHVKTRTIEDVLYEFAEAVRHERIECAEASGKVTGGTDE